MTRKGSPASRSLWRLARASLLMGLPLASGLPFAPAAAAAPTAGQLSNCVANVSGVARPEGVKRAVCAGVISALASVGPRLGLGHAQEVGGLGADAICQNGYVQGLVPALYIELNSDWYLGVSGGHSCAAAIEMGKEAYSAVQGF
jgi:hypothetical protein